MLFPVIDPLQWAKTYNLELSTRECLHCKSEVPVNLPVASKKYRGFRSQEHGCPKEYHQYLLVPISENENQSLMHGKSSF